MNTFHKVLLCRKIDRALYRVLSTSSKPHIPQVCIIGSGPAGFYTAQQILKSHDTAKVDIYERLPVPFGLVRYGVAPDHPEVKNCINTFTQTASKDRVSFLGNVSIGPDVTLSNLRSAYHAVVLAYGSAQDRKLNIPGETLSNVLSARRLVGWYNGLPEDVDLKVNLDIESAVVIGQGNVAVDVARILLTPVDILKKTDIPENVLEALTKSRVKRVTLIGRRGPEHVALTIKELREMVNLEGCRPQLIPQDYQHLRALIQDLPRSRKRLIELLSKTGLDPPDQKLASSYAKAVREWQLRFLRSPVEIMPTEDGQAVAGIKLVKNRLEGEGLNQRAIQTDETEILECGLLLRSIGYKGISIDPDLPFDDKTGTVANEDGRVLGFPGLYASGWISTGPVGVILSTMTSGFNTGKHIVADIQDGKIDASVVKSGKEDILEILAEKGVSPVTFNDWSRLNEHEIKDGEKLGKPREKVTDVRKMLDISRKSQKS